MSGRPALANDRIRAVVDLERGAEIASLTELTTGTEILMRTPWADRAQTLRPSRPGPVASSQDRWTDSYAGGWQVLFPHAGLPAEVDESWRGYHGEASTAVWRATEIGPVRLRAEVVLDEVPVQISRTVSVDGAELAVLDVLRNHSDRPVRYVYGHHPAFGAPFLGPTTRIEIPNASLRMAASVGPGVGDGDPVAVPAPDAAMLRFGTLEGFAQGWVRLTSPEVGVVCTLTWDDPDLAFAWFWIEAGATADRWWRSRGYTVAVEPCTTPVEPDRRRLLTLEPGVAREYRVALTVDRVGGEHL